MPTESTSVSSVGAAPSDDFDPQAQVVDAWGIRYPSFKAFLLGHPFEDDRCNEALRAFRSQGCSQAFCKTFAEGYRDCPYPSGEAERRNPPTFEPGASVNGWNWAREAGYVESASVTFRALSWHNIRLGFGYNNARRAAEPAPAG
jgi:hypothetical protein